MASLTFAVSEELKTKINKFPWVNWSEVAKEEFIKQEKIREEFDRFKKLVSKSKLTEKDAIKLGRKVNESMHKRFKKLYPELS